MWWVFLSVFVCFFADCGLFVVVVIGVFVVFLLFFWLYFFLLLTEKKVTRTVVSHRFRLLVLFSNLYNMQ